MAAAAQRRLYVPLPLTEGAVLALPPGPSRHAQVWRLQPGDGLVLFNGEGGEWAARVTRMGRSEVEVELGGFTPMARELPAAITLAVGMPANDRMDTVIEKATELGAAAIQPLVCERSVLRLAGERAERKVAHWQGVAVAAAEQCGRTRVPVIAPVAGLADWLAAVPAGARYVLSLRDAQPLAAVAAPGAAVFLSGPEGGLSPAEEAAALQAGFAAVTLGPRVLRADTAPLAALAWWSMNGQPAL